MKIFILLFLILFYANANKNFIPYTMETEIISFDSKDNKHFNKMFENLKEKEKMLLNNINNINVENLKIFLNLVKEYKILFFELSSLKTETKTLIFKEKLLIHQKNIYNYNLKEINKEIELKTIILNNL